ncbi:MAG: MIP/aquaporin family protein [Solidesulfovibrio sp. DCME]|uniref:MIP/aquaporin family protein n=1 Tax=Solidesulfovibrio sp. DCME TaxID=3447380 RepID=UPI003D13B980
MAAPSLLKRSLAELVGTYALVFLGTGSVMTTVLLAKGRPVIDNAFHVGIDMAAWVAIGLAFGLTVTAMIYCFGHISGTHINPAVSVALWATKRFPTQDLAAYVIAQCAGATLASLSVAAVWGARVIPTGLAATGMFDGVSYGQAFLCEVILTFILVMTIMGSAVDSRCRGGFAGLAIGLVVAADIIVGGNVTGASMNPARTFGPYLANILVGGPNMWAQYPIYLFGPLAGGVLAAFLYDLIGDPRGAEGECKLE